MPPIFTSSADASVAVYLIKSGEFEQFIKVEKAKERKVDSSQYTGPRQDTVKPRTLSLGPLRKHAGFKARVARLNKGTLIGDEDTINLSDYTKTTVCKSIKAEVYAITATDFINLVKNSNEAEAIIQNRDQHKLRQTFN